MKIEFLATSEDGLRWMLKYYERVFPSGRKNGLKKYKEAKTLLRENPLSGHEFDEIEGVRELKIPKTPFSIIYTLRDDIIYVIDIRDQRGIRSVGGLERFNR